VYNCLYVENVRIVYHYVSMSLTICHMSVCHVIVSYKRREICKQFVDNSVEKT